MKQFEQGKVKKQYICVVDGMWTEPLDHLRVVNAPIQRHEVSFVREVGTSKDNSSKPALTEFRVLDKSPQSNMMLLQAAPKTGRTHQIRVHALHSGVPIVGDDLYNPKEYVSSIVLNMILIACSLSSVSRGCDMIKLTSLLLIVK